jgi:hypothetical protein
MILFRIIFLEFKQKRNIPVNKWKILYPLSQITLLQILGGKKRKAGRKFVQPSNSVSTYTAAPSGL